MRVPLFVTRCRPMPVFGFAAALGALSGPAFAHAFGVRYDLPLPLWLYLAGAGVAVAVSFVIMAVFIRDHGDGIENMRIDLLGVPGLRLLAHPFLLGGVRILSVAVFAGILFAGVAGTSDPFKNIAPTFVWVVWWVGMAFISTLAGNLWDLVNPWRILFDRAERAVGGFPPARSYPAWLGHWPAVALFLVFVWMELIWEGAEKPPMLAALIGVYSVITWTGMVVFGRDTWLRHGEAFTVAFGVLSRFAPTRGEDGRWWLRLPAMGLLDHRPAGISLVCFTLLLLTSVTFDGILETPAWAGFLDWIAENMAVRPLLVMLQGWGVDLIAAIKTAALLVLSVVFIALFLAFSRLMAAAAGKGSRDPGLAGMAGYFVMSLVPIAIAYHLAHYLSYLLIAGQNIIPLASDPLGWGWDLMGTTAYNIDIGIINAKFVWYVAVTAIITGHVLAVVIAHVMALRVFKDPRQALRSQVPMLFLMVCYTMLGLWILSQPIIA